VPTDGKLREAQGFLDRHAGWLHARLQRATQPVPFAEGSIVPVRGLHHRIVATGSVRGRVEQTAGPDMPLLRVPGAPEHRARRLTDWLKTCAQDDLERQVAIHAQRLGVKVGSIRLRSQASRWGSCSSTGNLNFNWRLVMAPPFVLDYVAAHEVAHLVEMNHSAAFWKTVERTLPEMERGRAWLKANGRQLMAYGA
jgi:predicted metal-dependent hydrolase